MCRLRKIRRKKRIEAQALQTREEVEDLLGLSSGQVVGAGVAVEVGVGLGPDDAFKAELSSLEQAASSRRKIMEAAQKTQHRTTSGQLDGSLCLMC